MQQESLRESSHRYAKTKDQELVEYLADGRKIGERMRYEAVNEEADRLGDVDQQLHDMMVNAGELSGWDSLSERVRKMRDRQHQHQQQTQHQQSSAVAGKTLADFDEEERTRKVCAIPAFCFLFNHIEPYVPVSILLNSSYPNATYSKFEN